MGCTNKKVATIAMLVRAYPTGRSLWAFACFAAATIAHQWDLVLPSLVSFFFFMKSM